MNVGFIGLGRMGGAMARNIGAAGHSLVVYDVRPEARDTAIAFGATALANPAEIARRSEVVLISVPGPAEVEAVMSGSDGVFAGAGTNLLLIDMTTIGPQQSRENAQRGGEMNIFYIDAPVSGGQHGAVAGTLTVMVGGDQDAYQRALPVLECVASKVRHIGPSGSGSAIKLLNQAIYVSYMAAFAEGLTLGEDMGLSVETMLDVFETSAAGHAMMATKYDDIRNAVSRPGFPIRNALMFLDLTQQAAEDIECASPVFASVAEAFRGATQRGLGEDDIIVTRAKYLKP